MIRKQNITFDYNRNINGYVLIIRYNQTSIYRHCENWPALDEEWKTLSGWNQKSPNFERIQAIALATIDKLQKEADRILDRDLIALLSPKKNQLAKTKKPDSFQNLELYSDSVVYSKKIFVICLMVIGTVGAAAANFLIIALFSAIIAGCYYKKEIRGKELITITSPLSIEEKEQELDAELDELDRVALAEG